MNGRVKGRRERGRVVNGRVKGRRERGREGG